MQIPNIILISGMSGAGKTTAMGVLEDMGYRCIDQLPFKLLPSLIDYSEEGKDVRFTHLALSTYISDFQAFYTYLSGLNFNLSVVLLDASDSELLKRYKFSRRMHPMLLSNAASTLEEGIAAERRIFSQIKEQTITTLDTSVLTATELKQRLNQLIEANQHPVVRHFYIQKR
jgi:UPF0042 nucleotide-binding protein